jgi:nucleotide-binding universal stress UspA family protein
MLETQRPYVILSALVFDETGDCALNEAVRLTVPSPNAKLHVVHVMPDLGEAQGDHTSAVRKEVERAPSLMEERVKIACAGTALEVRGHIRHGDPVELILRTAAEIDADVLVIGSHRRHGVEKLILGSVAERILQGARCSVLTALPKNWQRTEQIQLDPPCPDCVRVRQEAGDPSLWCERHSRSRLRPHVYSPSDRPSPAIVWT